MAQKSNRRRSEERLEKKAPDFALPGTDGKNVRLSGFRGSNVAIDFYRGYWQPYRMAEIGKFVKGHEGLWALDVQVLAVSLHAVDKSGETEAKLRAPLPILPDSHDKLMDMYGARSPMYKGRNGAAINTPTFVLIDRTGTIRWLHRAADYRLRTPISEGLKEIRKLKSRSRASRSYITGACRRFEPSYVTISSPPSTRITLPVIQ